MSFRLSSFRQSWAALLAITALLIAAPSVSAQSYQGSVRGRVTDPSGAAVPETRLTLVEENTGVSRETVTSGSGDYVFASVNPGRYTVLANTQSFSTFKQSGITVGTQDGVTVDIALRVGDAKQVLEVKAETPLINTSDASNGQTLDREKLTDLPILGRNPYMLTRLSTNFEPTGNPQFVRFADQNGTSQVSIAGGPVAGNNYLVDGIPITDTNNRPVVIPTIEAIGEVKVQVNTYDAELGRTGGGVYNTYLKSGTNELHGALLGYTRQADWLANDFFSNASGTPRPDSPFYNYAGSFGGPVVVPKLYNGKNRTFFWVSEEGYRQASPYSETFAVPTAAERRGDFSQSFTSAGTLDTIYDPASTTVDANGVVHRNAFTGNQIPSNRLSPVGLAIASFYPLPQHASATGQNNYTGTDDVKDRADEFVAKVDQQFFSWWNANASYIHYGSLQPLGNPLQTLPGSYSYTYRRHVDATQLNNVFTPNPTTVINVRFGYNRFPNIIQEVSAGFDPAALRFPASFTDAIQNKFFPTIEMQNYSTLGQDTSSIDIWHSQNLSGNVEKYLGRHSLKLGADYRSVHMDFQDFGDAPGTFGFSGAFTRANPNVVDGTGSDLADLLLGYPSSGQAETSTKLFTYFHYYAGYVQDDFRVTSKLTVNLGLRYEYETGLQEERDHLAIGFSPQARTTLGTVGVTGGVEFAGIGGNSSQAGDLQTNKFAPRLGFAYAVDAKTTVRGGYGILYGPLRYDPSASLAPGYTQYTPYVASNNGLLNPATGISLSNPFPSGLVQPAGSAAGLLTGVGGSLTLLASNLKSPRIQQFSADLQRELPGHIALEVGYSGSRSDNLQPGATGGGTININQLDPQQFALGGALTDPVANPFYANGGTGVIGSATVSRSQLLLPYPQFSTVNLLTSSSWASYDSVIAKVQKRLSNGLTFIAAYTWSRNKDASFGTSNSVQGTSATGPQNAYNLNSEYSLAVNDTPDRFVSSVTYDLPFGRGRQFLHKNRWVDYAVGGWQLNVITTFQTGFPLAIRQSDNLNAFLGTGAQRPNATGLDPATHGSVEQRLYNYINPAAFSEAPAYTFGNVSRTIPLRGPGIANWDASLFKDFVFAERIHAQFRAESFNVFNTPEFAAPNTSYGSPNFGQITSQVNFPRYIQLGARVSF